MPRLPSNPSPQLVQAQRSVQHLTAETKQALREWSKALAVHRRAAVRRIRGSGSEGPVSQQERDAEVEAEKGRTHLIRIREQRAEATEHLVRQRWEDRNARLGISAKSRDVVDDPSQLSKADQLRLEKAQARFAKNWLKKESEKRRKKAAASKRRSSQAVLRDNIASATRKDQIKFDRYMQKVQADSEKKLAASAAKSTKSRKQSSAHTRKVRMRRELRKLETQRRRLERRLADLEG